MKRFAVALLIALVGVPWSAVPAATGAGCSMSKAAMASMRASTTVTVSAAAVAPAKSSCAYCAATPPASSVSAAIPASPDVPSLGAGCCRFRTKAEGVVAQAGTLGASPKPLQSPDHAAALAAFGLASVSLASVARSGDFATVSPPHASPTRTTHLLL